MLRVWFVFLGVSFLISLVTLTRIQTKVPRRVGWRALAHDPVQHYWMEISPLERMLLWCGIGAFLLTTLGAAVARIVAGAA
jgi:type II secretory pathway component PulM